MARTTKPLSDTEVKQAKPREKEYNLADGDGLYLRVKPNGSKLWIFNYSRPYTKKRANLGLGQYPSPTLSKAREIRQQFLDLLVDDIDPATFRKEQARLEKDAHNNTFENVAKKWLTTRKRTLSHGHWEGISRSFELHIYPRLGNVPIHLIKATDTIDLLNPIAAKGSLETVNRLCQRLNNVMTFAVNGGLIQHNPLTGISKVFEAPLKKHFPTLAPDRLPELMITIANASIKRTTRCLLEWQLHTMTRPGEAAGTRWEEIDVEKGLWIIPEERMKKKRPHAIPLSPQAITLLEVMKPISAHREHVFPADRKPRAHANDETANMALKRMGFKGTLVAHGLRSLASTILNEQGFDPDLIETALAHKDKDQVRDAYNRADYLERRKVMMAWWSNHIEEAGTGSLSVSGSLKHLRTIAT
jgi:integrase